MKFPWFPSSRSHRSTPRSRRIRSILRWFAFCLLLVTVLLGSVGWEAVRQSWPVEQGQLTLPGLSAPVTVVRDDQGVPQIYADTTADLMFAQGYIQAQDRFWQMDVWRHVGAGRLAEMFGEKQVDTDRFLRTLGWESIAQREWARIQAEDPQMREVMERYAAGINAYLADRRGIQLSLEHGILGLLNRDYEPAPWHPVNSLTWAKVMAYDLGASHFRENSQIARRPLR
ncbi:MAG: penicillin acylase family protein [Prochlorothrix sp.]